jgi:hypothetical protein
MMQNVSDRMEVCGVVCGLQDDVPGPEHEIVNRKLPGGYLVDDIQDVQECKHKTQKMSESGSVNTVT